MSNELKLNAPPQKKLNARMQESKFIFLALCCNL